MWFAKSDSRWLTCQERRLARTNLTFKCRRRAVTLGASILRTGWVPMTCDSQSKISSKIPRYISKATSSWLRLTRLRCTQIARSSVIPLCLRPNLRTQVSSTTNKQAHPTATSWWESQRTMAQYHWRPLIARRQVTCRFSPRTPRMVTTWVLARLAQLQRWKAIARQITCSHEKLVSKCLRVTSRARISTIWRLEIVSYWILRLTDSRAVYIK